MALVKDNAQYGDMKRLEQLSSGLKQSNGDSVPTVRTPVGRPQGATGTTQPVAPGGVTPESTIPEEHRALMVSAARAMRVFNVGKQLTSDPLAGAWLRAYAERAQLDAEERLRAVKDLAPDYQTG
jgi:hypothetical protein